MSNIKQFFERTDVQSKFAELLGERKAAFITSLLQVVNSNPDLMKAEPTSIYNAAATAASMNLPINPNLGFAYILAYNMRQKDGSYKMVAQFQMGYKGFIQLAQRSGQFKTLGVAPIRAGQIVSHNLLDGLQFDFENNQDAPVIGFAAHFKLMNGFEKTWYMTNEQLKAHGVKYSKTFAKGYGLWKDQFESMAEKTVIKLLLSKYAPLSIEMQKAVEYDQAVISETGVKYVDNTEPEIDKVAERMRLLLNDCRTVEEVNKFQQENPDHDIQIFNNRIEEIINGKTIEGSYVDGH